MLFRGGKNPDRPLPSPQELPSGSPETTDKQVKIQKDFRAVSDRFQELCSGARQNGIVEQWSKRIAELDAAIRGAQNAAADVVDRVLGQLMQNLPLLQQTVDFLERQRRESILFERRESGPLYAGIDNDQNQYQRYIVKLPLTQNPNFQWQRLGGYMRSPDFVYTQQLDQYGRVLPQSWALNHQRVGDHIEVTVDLTQGTSIQFDCTNDAGQPKHAVLTAEQAPQVAPAPLPSPSLPSAQTPEASAPEKQKKPRKKRAPKEKEVPISFEPGKDERDAAKAKKEEMDKKAMADFRPGQDELDAAKAKSDEMVMEKAKTDLVDRVKNGLESIVNRLGLHKGVEIEAKMQEAKVVADRLRNRVKGLELGTDRELLADINMLNPMLAELKNEGASKLALDELIPFGSVDAEAPNDGFRIDYDFANDSEMLKMVNKEQEYGDAQKDLEKRLSDFGDMANSLDTGYILEQAALTPVETVHGEALQKIMNHPFLKMRPSNGGESPMLMLTRVFRCMDGEIRITRDGDHMAIERVETREERAERLKNEYLESYRDLDEKLAELTDILKVEVAAADVLTFEGHPLNVAWKAVENHPFLSLKSPDGVRDPVVTPRVITNEKDGHVYRITRAGDHMVMEKETGTIPDPPPAATPLPDSVDAPAPLAPGEIRIP